MMAYHNHDLCSTEIAPCAICATPTSHSIYDRLERKPNGALVVDNRRPCCVDCMSRDLEIRQIPSSANASETPGRWRKKK